MSPGRPISAAANRSCKTGCVLLACSSTAFFYPRDCLQPAPAVSHAQYGVRTPLSLPLKASLCLSLFDAPSSSLLPSPSAASNDAPRIPHRISFLSCATFPTLYPSTAAKGWGLALRWPWSARRRGGAKLGWKGVNELVLDGLERLDEREEEKGRGRRREEGQGGMCVLIDFVEFPPDAREGGETRGELVERVIECNFR